MKAQEEALLEALDQAENKNMHDRPCQACAALESMPELVRSRVERALAGTIGENKLADILTESGYYVRRRAIRRHRAEGHA